MPQFGMQVNVSRVNGKDDWQWVHPTGGQPYRYDTEKEARDMLEMCYPMENSRTVRVQPFPEPANAGA